MSFRKPRHGRAVTCLLLALLALAGCAKPEAPAAPAERQLTVFAAASLRDAFTELANGFRTAHAGAEVTFNFAGSQELRAQMEQGAPADVFASADTKHMDALAKTGRVEAPKQFARNEPVLVVARESAATVQSLADLPKLERIVLGAAEVPIGRYAQQVLDRAEGALGTDFRARVEAKVVSRELNVRQVLSKVSLGEAQAGIVYRTDARSAKDRVKTVTIAPAYNVVAEYPIAAVKDAAHPVLARAWVDLVLSPEGQKALANAGFSAPASAP
ncbi:MAG: molybdate ABC transporter substrate-binding protein [Polyangiales bacterium]